MAFFEHHDDELREGEAPAPSKGSGQKIRVATIERDNGLVTATNSSISNALYDLADQNSLTHTVVLPHGTTVKLAATNSPTMTGAWRSRFSIENGKLGRTVEAKGSSSAADLANQIDLLALAKIDKDALSKVTEAHAAGDAEGVLVALGLREERLEEIEIHVSGYTTKKGKHVGAYSQIRKAIDKLGPGQSLHFPDGIAVKRTSNGYSVGTTSGIKKIGGAHRPSAKAAADDVAQKSASLDHPKSIGGRVQHSIDKPTEINSIPNSGDNPKLPGAPHPSDVAHRAAKARKEAVKRLPSRKERAENERKAKDRRQFDAEVEKERSAIKGYSRKRKAEEEAENVRVAQDVAKLTPEGQKRYERYKGEGHDHASSLRGAKSSERRERDESPMPGVIRKPSEVDAIRAKQGRASQDKASKSAAANIDREKRKRAKAVAKHPAAKARRRFKGLSEAETPGLIGR